MVAFDRQWLSAYFAVSVLALSSRFDGPLNWDINRPLIECFSTRSVESF